MIKNLFDLGHGPPWYLASEYYLHVEWKALHKHGFVRSQRI